MVTLEIYEPPIGCGVGSCGPDAEDELARFSSAVEWLENCGVEVARYNLGFEPEAFTRNAMVKAAIKEHGIACLPIVIGDGRVVCERHYPSPSELSQQLGQPLPAPWFACDCRFPRAARRGGRRADATRSPCAKCMPAMPAQAIDVG